MAIEIKQMVVKSTITQAQSQSKEVPQASHHSAQDKKIIINELNRSINKLATQTRER